VIGIVQAAIEMFSTIGIAVADSMIEFLRLFRTTSASTTSFTHRSLDPNLPIVSKITNMVITIVVPNPAIGTTLIRIKEV
jgi:hypothetical protein